MSGVEQQKDRKPASPHVSLISHDTDAGVPAGRQDPAVRGGGHTVAHGDPAPSGGHAVLVKVTASAGDTAMTRTIYRLAASPCL